MNGDVGFQGANSRDEIAPIWKLPRPLPSL
jgi:hypothetical protein